MTTNTAAMLAEIEGRHAKAQKSHDEPNNQRWEPTTAWCVYTAYDSHLDRAWLLAHVKSLQALVPVWRPIGEAPKDGTEILYRAECVNTSSTFYGSMKWRDREGEHQHWWDDSSTLEVFLPTGWMEIPK